MRLRERQNNFAQRSLDAFLRDQSYSCLGKLASEYASYVEQRVAAAHHAGVMWAITDDIAFGTQNSFFQRDRVQNPGAKHRSLTAGTIHHRTSEKRSFILLALRMPWRSRIKLVTTSVRCSDLFDPRLNLSRQPRFSGESVRPIARHGAADSTE
jgi:hypothetical protein